MKEKKYCEEYVRGFKSSGECGLLIPCKHPGHRAAAEQRKVGEFITMLEKGTPYQLERIRKIIEKTN